MQLLFLAAVALLVYAPSLTIPLIADDYPNIAQALTYGAPGGAGTLLHDAQFRMRATSYWAMYGLWHMAGLTAPVYHAASLLLHVANTWLVFFVVAAWPRMRPAAFWTAAFFAVLEGHQEAVMWFSAINELLMFSSNGVLWCWRRPMRATWLKNWREWFAFALRRASPPSSCCRCSCWCWKLSNYAAGCFDWRRTCAGVTGRGVDRQSCSNCSLHGRQRRMRRS